MSAFDALEREWTRLTLSVNERGRIPVRHFYRVFSAGRSDKAVAQHLRDMYLPTSKTDDIDPSDFPFDRFYVLYNKVCPRTDIYDLFKSMLVAAFFSAKGLRDSGRVHGIDKARRLQGAAP